mgnify:CR=1 FL=1
MIKYVELTAPESSAYRQAKILSIECHEGDRVKQGQTLFRVKSGNREIDLPSTRDGRIVEIIATEQENITLSTPLLLLETVVKERTASKPVAEPSESGSADQTRPPVQPTETQRPAPTNRGNDHKRHEQQSLNLSGETSKEIVLDQVVESPSTKIETVSQPDVTQPDVTSKPTVSKSMSNSETIEISVPDIGADSAKVVEILVQVGDQIAVDDPLVTLESDKASMDVPSTKAGVVKSISVEVDQDVHEGVAILTLEADTDGADAVSEATDDTPESESAAQDKAPTNQPSASSANEPSASGSVQTIEVKIPDIGGDSAKVVEILVTVGQEVALEDSLITLESDKASMDVPSSAAGVIKSIEVAVDDEVSEGLVIAIIESASDQSATSKASETPNASTDSANESKSVSEQPKPAPKPAAPTQGAPKSPAGQSHASPSIRRFARELGVDLGKVTGTGRKQRVTKDDVKAYVKSTLESGASSTASTGSGIPPIPAQDFSKFGDIELQPLNKIKRLTAENLHRSWVNVPHVTHNDESDISDLESFRKQLNSEYAKQGKDIKLSPLAFIVKAVVNAMQEYPQFNSSLEPGGENLILKKYFNIGIAVDTPNGLVVPVVKDADKKSVAEIAREMGELAEKARDKKLTMNDMSGACFTISSLGGIGGTGFTPIVNAPEVAILGVSRSKIKPVWNGSEFVPGTMLPLSLSYDHRVIDGAEAARFTHHIAKVLEDVRRLTV